MRSVYTGLFLLFTVAIACAMEKDDVQGNSKNTTKNSNGILSLKELCTRVLPKFCAKNGVTLQGVIYLPLDLQESVRKHFLSIKSKKKSGHDSFEKWAQIKGIDLKDLSITHFCLLGALYDSAIKNGKKTRVTNPIVAGFYNALSEELKIKLKVHVNQKLLRQYSQGTLISKLEKQCCSDCSK